jgi:hypothetical protein
MKAKRRPRLDIAVISRYNTMLRLETCYLGRPADTYTSRTDCPRDI